MQEILKKIESELGHGTKTRIAKKAGVSFVTVCNCFNGKSKNILVFEAANTLYQDFVGKCNSLASLIKTSE